MDAGLDQITHGLMVGGIGFPVLSGMVGVTVAVFSAKAVRMITVTRLVFAALGIGVAAGVASGTIPVVEGAACLVGQVVAWGLLLGPGRSRK